MWRSNRRRRTLDSWRARRLADGLEIEAPVADVSAGRLRRRPANVRVPEQLKAAGREALRWPVAGFLALVLAALAGSVSLWRAPAFRISGAYVSGNQRVPAEIIYRASYLAGQWAFTVNRADAARRIEVLDDVTEARVRVTWPAKVSIEVRETAPVLVWSGPSGILAVDETGRAITPPANADGLATVADEAGLLTAPGDQLPGGVFEAALAYSGTFGALVYRRPDGFVARTPDGITLRLGTDAGLLAEQTRMLGALLAQIDDVRGTAALIDLRFPSRPYYRLGGGR
jgi:hypothetical protein